MGSNPNAGNMDQIWFGSAQLPQITSEHHVSFKFKFVLSVNYHAVLFKYMSGFTINVLQLSGWGSQV